MDSKHKRWQTVVVNGNPEMLKPHDGHEVQVRGTKSNDQASLQVSSVAELADSCSKQQASTGTKPMSVQPKPPAKVSGGSAAVSGGAAALGIGGPESSQKLPATASPLPLLGWAGFLSIVAGGMLRGRRVAHLPNPHEIVGAPSFRGVCERIGPTTASPSFRTHDPASIQRYVTGHDF
jgi:hypothetical protein